MSDDRYTFLHASSDAIAHIAEEDFVFELPNESIDVPAHLVPLYQDEEDDSILPTNSHPSYPYGNPYRATAASKLSAPFSTAHRSLATSLPTLYRAQLGNPVSQQRWTDLGLDGLLPYDPPQEHVTAPSAIPDEPRPGGHAQHTPAGQRNQGEPGTVPATDAPIADSDSSRAASPTASTP